MMSSMVLPPPCVSASQSAPSPDTQQAAIALAAVKDKPFGWPRERGHP
jgi:hypothetical protein